MAEEIKKELEEKEIKVKEKAKGPGWFEKAPAYSKIIGTAIVIIAYMRLDNKSEIIYWIAGALLLIYFTGQRMEELPTDLSPVEAKKLVRKELEFMKEMNEIPKSTIYQVGPICTLKYHNSLPTYYLISVIFNHQTRIKEFKAAKVYLDSRYVMIEDTLGGSRITGKEAVPTRIILGDDIKTAKKFGIFDKFF